MKIAKHLHLIYKDALDRERQGNGVRLPILILLPPYLQAGLEPNMHCAIKQTRIKHGIDSVDRREL